MATISDEYPTEEELLERLKHVEDNFTEHKSSSVNVGEIRRTVVAFANSVPEGQTGILYIGVRHNRDIEGLPNADKLQRTVRRICEKDCYPPVAHRSQVLYEQGRAFLAIVVPASDNPPHFSGRAHVRIGSETVDASEKLFDELVTRRLSKPYKILKWKDKTVTVITRAKRLGRLEFLEYSFKETYECRIRECTSDYVRLFDTKRDEVWTEPLENIKISEDVARNRLMLIIKEP